MTTLSIGLLLVAVHDPAAREVIGRQLYDNTIVREDSDVVHSHFAADVGEHFVPIVEFYSEHGVRK